MVDSKLVEIDGGNSPSAAASQVGLERLFQAVIDQSLKEAKPGGGQSETARAIYSEDKGGAPSNKRVSLADYAGSFLQFSNKIDKSEGALLEHMISRTYDDRRMLQAYATMSRGKGSSDIDAAKSVAVFPRGNGVSVSSADSRSSTSVGGLGQVSDPAQFKADSVLKAMEASTQRQIEMNNLTTELTLAQNAKKIETELMVWEVNKLFRQRSTISEMTNSIIKQVSELFGRLTQG